MSIKSFSKSTIIYAIGTIALRFTTFLLIPLYTHYLSQEEFGLLQTLLFSVQIIITINDVGMRSALMRFFSEYDISNRIDKLLGSSLSLNITVGFLLILISCFIPDRLISNFFHIDLIPHLAILTITVGVAQTLSLNILSYFRAKDNGIAYVIISIITSLLLILNTYIFLVVMDLGIVGILYAQIITFFTMWLVVLLWIVFKHGLSIDKNLVKTLFKFGFPLVFAMSGDLIINTSGNYFLGHFRNLEDVALYSLGYKIASISIMVLIGPFQMAYEPYIFKNKESAELQNIISRITTYITIIFIIISFGILFVFRDLILLLGKIEYAKSYYLIFWILPGIGFTALSYIGQSLLHIKNKTNITGVIFLFITIISLFVSYFTIKNFGTYGLIFSINFYLIFSSITLFYFGNKLIPIKLEYGRLFVLLLVAILLFISVYIFSFYSDYIYYLSSIIMFGLMILFLFKSKFLNMEEKSKMNTIISNLKIKLNF